MDTFAATTIVISLAYFYWFKEKGFLQSAAMSIGIGLIAITLYAQAQRILDNDTPRLTKKEVTSVGKFGHDLFDTTMNQVAKSLKP